MKRTGVGGVEDFAQVARELHAAPDEGCQLQLAVDLAVRLIGGCDHAGVSAVEVASFVRLRAPMTWSAVGMPCNMN